MTDQKTSAAVQPLHPAEVEKALVQTVIDLHAIIVIDGIDKLESPPGFRIGSHDLHGPLPDVIVYDSGARYRLLEQIGRETAKIYPILQNRERLSQQQPLWQTNSFVSGLRLS
jgi:hypothetical protein